MAQSSFRDKIGQFIGRGTDGLDADDAFRLRRLNTVVLLGVAPHTFTPLVVLALVPAPVSYGLAAVAAAVWIGWLEASRITTRRPNRKRIAFNAHVFIGLSMVWMLTLVSVTGLGHSPWLFMLVACPAVAAYVLDVREALFWSALTITVMIVVHLIDGFRGSDLGLMFSPLVAQITVTMIVSAVAIASQFETDQHLVDMNSRKSRISRQAAQLARQNEMLTRHAEADLTKRKRAEAELAHRRLHDHLTGLPNRTLFHSRVEQALLDADDSVAVAVLFVDIDQFKIINDSLGHAIGDELLVAVAERLVERLLDVDTVTRLGGDEFALLVHCGNDPSRASFVAQRVQALFEEPFEVQEHEISTTVSIGIALGSDVEQLPQDLMRHADAAMYQAKAEGRGTARVFDHTSKVHLRSRFETAAALNQALARSELVLHYQPEVDLTSEKILGVEALVRWHHPTRGLLAASEFVELAEETGLIVRIGEWVLREAFKQARAWAEGTKNGVHVRINVSPNQLYKGDIVHMVDALLDETGVEPHTICLEVTESAVLEFGTDALRTLEELRALGVQLAIDDFGTGYSSLSYLKQIPADTLKIDRSFVSNLENDPKDRSIIAAVLELANQLGFGSVVEGVETEEQRVLLQDLGCINAQGYLFSRPLPADKVTEMLVRGSLRPPAKTAEPLPN